MAASRPSSGVGGREDQGGIFSFGISAEDTYKNDLHPGGVEADLGWGAQEMREGRVRPQAIEGLSSPTDANVTEGQRNARRTSLAMTGRDDIVRRGSFPLSPPPACRGDGTSSPSFVDRRRKRIPKQGGSGRVESLARRPVPFSSFRRRSRAPLLPPR